MEKTFVNLIVVDDYNPVLDSLSLLLEKEEGIRLAGTVATLSEAISMLEMKQADIMLLRIPFPRKSNLNIIRNLRKIYTSLRILLIVEHLDVHSALMGFKAGVSGYLQTTAPPEEYIRAIRKAASGGKYVMNWLAGKLVEELNAPSRPALHEILTDREFLVMCLIAAGKTTRDIADQLRVTDKTISGYRKQILTKMRIKTIPEITRYFNEHVH